jgi:hypothetical protein
MKLKEELTKSSTNGRFKLSRRTKVILDALEDFTKTGIISNALVEGFTQHGNWIGIYNAEEIGKYNSLMLGHILPKDRRTFVDKSGNVHLLTSYKNIDKSPKITLSYKTVAGSIWVPFCKELDAQNLEKVGGKIDLGSTKKLSLPKIKSVGGFINLPKVKEASLPKLESIGGILSAYRVTKLELDKLKEVKNVKLESLSINAKKRIIRNLSLKSLLSIKNSAYNNSEVTIVNQEIKKRKLLKDISTKAMMRELSII